MKDVERKGTIKINIASDEVRFVITVRPTRVVEEIEGLTRRYVGIENFEGISKQPLFLEFDKNSSTWFPQRFAIMSTRHSWKTIFQIESFPEKRDSRARSLILGASFSATSGSGLRSKRVFCPTSRRPCTATAVPREKSRSAKTRVI